MAMVDRPWLLMLPTRSTTCTALPDGASSGIRTFTWKAPDTRPGAEPAYCTSAGRPPTVTVTGAIGCFNWAGSGGITRPVTPGGFVGPSPVANMTMEVPFGAGNAGPLMVPF